MAGNSEVESGLGLATSNGLSLFFSLALDCVYVRRDKCAGRREDPSRGRAGSL